MRLTRCHVAAPLAEHAELVLEPRVGAHLTRVLRLAPGAALSVFDGAGHEHAATISAVHGARVAVRLGAALEPVRESPLAITLAQGVSRGERMDYAIQKATELGVARIAPVLCERSVVKLDERQALAKLEHWRGVAIAAAEQCGRAQLPLIEPPVRLAEFLAANAGPAAASSLKAVLVPDAREGLAALPAPPGAALLLIGPEGGLSEEEARLALAAGFRALRLGPRVLRTETAAAAAIAALQALYGDLG